MNVPVTLRTRHVVPASAQIATRPGSNEKFFGSDGNLNAGSRKELIETIATLMQQVGQGQLSMVTAEQQEELARVRRERNDHFALAYSDRSSPLWQETGGAIGADVSLVAMREGFMRRFLQKADLAQGQTPRIRVKFANVTAVLASSVSQVYPQLVRDNYLYPPEWYINANIRVEERDIVQGSGDVLDTAFTRTQEQIMVVEDRVYKGLLDTTVGVANPQQVLAGGLTPSTLAALREQIITWGLQARNFLMAADYWTDIVGNAASWANLFDPVTQFEIVQTGYLGQILGLSIVTDAFREPNQRVIAQGECYITASPDTHGAYTDRGPVVAVPKDVFDDNIPGRGWAFYELLSMTLANARSVVKGVKA